ncbi:MAG: sensor histidine kinase [Candidatus Kryptoniota bacterium]
MASKNPSSLNIKLGLVAIAVVIAAGTLFYTQHIVNLLLQREHKIVHLYARSLQYLASDQSVQQDYSFIFDEVLSSIDFPMILTDANNQPLQPYSRNIRNVELDTSLTTQEQRAYLLKLIHEMDSQYAPIKVALDTIVLNYVHYGESGLVTQLRYLPYVEFAVASLFVLIGYVAFSYIKKSEQSNIWVGMSRETAHQLGTPLSSLMGWMEILKATEDPVKKNDIIAEIERDLTRLNKITMRFSKIGSIPMLKPTRISEVVENVFDYLGRRIPQTGKKISLILEGDRKVSALLNAELFEWVLENLIKNALDAIEGSDGTVRVNIARENGHAVIDVSDTGKGIDMKFRRDIFRPGYSTKKRGWGLGLSLAKRIVETYHDGQIYLKESHPGKGSTFRIKLKVS